MAIINTTITTLYNGLGLAQFRRDLAAAQASAGSTNALVRELGSNTENLIGSIAGLAGETIPNISNMVNRIYGTISGIGSATGVIFSTIGAGLVAVGSLLALWTSISNTKKNILDYTRRQVSYERSLEGKQEEMLDENNMTKKEREMYEEQKKIIEKYGVEKGIEFVVKENRIDHIVNNPSARENDILNSVKNRRKEIEEIRKSDVLLENDKENRIKLIEEEISMLLRSGGLAVKSDENTLSTIFKRSSDAIFRTTNYRTNEEEEAIVNKILEKESIAEEKRMRNTILIPMLTRVLEEKREKERIRLEKEEREAERREMEEQMERQRLAEETRRAMQEAADEAERMAREAARAAEDARRRRQELDKEGQETWEEREGLFLEYHDTLNQMADLKDEYTKPISDIMTSFAALDSLGFGGVVNTGRDERKEYEDQMMEIQEESRGLQKRIADATDRINVLVQELSVFN